MTDTCVVCWKPPPPAAATAAAACGVISVTVVGTHKAADESYSYPGTHTRQQALAAKPLTQLCAPGVCCLYKQHVQTTTNSMFVPLLCCATLQMAKTADHIDGSQIGDKEFVEKLIRYSMLNCVLKC
jgi:hypothetical protein